MRLQYLRYTGDVYYEVHRLLSLFSIMKREDWSPTFLTEKTLAYKTDIKTRDEYFYKRAGKRRKNFLNFKPIWVRK